jgi:hypothetical protein
VWGREQKIDAATMGIGSPFTRVDPHPLCFVLILPVFQEPRRVGSLRIASL